MPSIVVFGDSIAHGGRDMEHGGWPLRLRRHMRQHDLGDALWVQARSGDTSFNLRRRLPIEIGLRPAETVLIAIGTNDAQVLMDADHPRVSDGEYADNLSFCITTAKQHARWVIPIAPTQVAASPRPGPRPILPQRIQALGDMVAQVAVAHGCWWLDLRQVLDDSCRPDGIHPDTAGHARMAAAVWQGLLPTGCLGERAKEIPALAHQ